MASRTGHVAKDDHETWRRLPHLTAEQQAAQDRVDNQRRAQLANAVVRRHGMDPDHLDAGASDPDALRLAADQFAALRDMLGLTPRPADAAPGMCRRCGKPVPAWRAGGRSRVQGPGRYCGDACARSAAGGA